MPASLQYDTVAQIADLHISGILSRGDMVVCEREIAAHIDAGGRPGVLVTLENFGGWEKDGDWDNFDFMFSYGEKIAKIAIVGAGDKEAEVAAFTGAGLRPTPVAFFGTPSEARAWLLG